MTSQVPSETAGDAVLQTAIQMEEMGGDFYEAFAAATGDPKVRQLSLRLAAAELNHRKLFQQMRSELARQGKTVLLENEDLAGMRLGAKESVLPDPDTVRRILSQGDVRALLDLAIQMEEGSIRFYGRFVNSVPERGVLEAIIREEQEHLRLLRAAGRGEEIKR